MRHKARLILVVTVFTGIMVLPSTASAQYRRTPYPDLNAVSAGIGVFAPHEEGMSTGLLVDGMFEHYMSSRDSVRLDASWASPHRSDDSAVGTHQLRIGGDILHNWEGGSIHPYVGAGLGVYVLQNYSHGTNIGDHATKLGGDLIGGVEFFTTRTFSVKGEAAYHIVMKSGDYNPSGLALSIGAKAYF